jgi:hypothetical protein
MRPKIFPLPIKRVKLSIVKFLKTIHKRTDPKDIDYQFQECKRVLYEAFGDGYICKDGLKAGMSLLTEARTKMAPARRRKYETW